jgi:hypothetical protein
MSAASTQLLRDGLRIRARLQLENAHVHPLQRLRGDVGQRFRAHQGRPIIDDRTAQGIGADAMIAVSIWTEPSRRSLPITSP